MLRQCPLFKRNEITGYDSPAYLTGKLTVSSNEIMHNGVIVGLRVCYELYVKLYELTTMENLNAIFNEFRELRRGSVDHEKDDL